MSIAPLDRDLAEALLKIGLFAPVAAGLVSSEWERLVPEEAGRVIAGFEGTRLALRLAPTISVYDHHRGKRLMAGIYFELAAKYAEKVGGKIVQHSNVGECKLDGGTERVLAQYPDMPLLWEMVCPGFREVIMGEPA